LDLSSPLVCNKGIINSQIAYRQCQKIYIITATNCDKKYAQ
jgi:hypothetical protein